jgi:hypothetical protein
MAKDLTCTIIYKSYFNMVFMNSSLESREEPGVGLEYISHTHGVYIIFFYNLEGTGFEHHTCIHEFVFPQRVIYNNYLNLIQI